MSKVESEAEQEERRFKHWADLNDEGKEEWGDVFPDGEIPVVSLIPRELKLRDHKELAFLVYIPELTDEQFKAIVEKLHKKFDVPKNRIRKGLLEEGLPLRASLTSGSGTTQPLL